MKQRLAKELRRPKLWPISSLLWETLSPSTSGKSGDRLPIDNAPRQTRRLPFETQCAAITKSGRRCRGKIRKETDFCTFHDPTVTEEHRRRNAAKGGQTPRRLSRLPDGYLRKLTNRPAVGNAMDRLYREIRLGHMTPEMGRVLFDILTRMLDSGLCDGDGRQSQISGRSRADRLRPKLDALLTYTERRAWKKAVANAPEHLIQGGVPPHQAEHRAAIAWTAAS